MTPLAVVSYAFIVLVGLLFAKLFLFPFRLGRVRGGPVQVLESVRRRLSLATYVVSEKGGELIVRASDWVDARIAARASGADSELDCRVDPTADAAVFLFLAFFPAFFLAAVGVPEAFLPFGAAETFAATALFVHGRRFAFGVVLPSASLPSVPRPPNEFRDLLVSRLEELHRLAGEAGVALRARSGRAVLLAALVAIIVLGTVVFLLVRFDPAYLARDATVTVGIGALAALALFLPARAILRRRSDPRAAPVLIMQERLWNAMTRESSGQPPRPGEGSTYELLAEASWASPWWLALSVKEFLFYRRSPRLAWLNAIFAVGALAYLFAILATLLSGWVGLAVQGLFLLSLLAMTGVNMRAFRWWQRERVREEEERRAAWEQRLWAFRNRADGFLRDL